MICAITLLAVLAAATAAARGDAPWYEGFEGTEPSWRPADGSSQVQILAHRRVRGQAFTGQSCEHLALAAPTGAQVYFGHDVARPWVIAELRPTVRLRSDRAAVQFVAQIALPRTADPRTGRPLRTLVHGSTYTTVGRWQQLRIEDIPQQLARRTRVLRAEFGPEVDPREAYVEQVLLSVGGGKGVAHLWIDDLDVDGYAGPAPGPTEPAGPAGPADLPSQPEHTGLHAPSRPAAAPSLDVAGWTGSQSERVATPRRPPVRWDGSTLLVDGRPFFPRMVRYQGESLALLQRLGFNVVWLRELPSAGLLDEASRLGLWLVCPPPRAGQAGAPGGATGRLAPIGSDYRRVLAWNLGRDLAADDLETVRQWATQVRAADRETARPLVCQPAEKLREYSRLVDVLVIGRPPLGTSLELSAYGTWLRQRPRLARPGNCIWTTVQTELAPSVLSQWRGLGVTLPSDCPAVTAEQIRLLTYTAVTAGARGLLFESQSPLDRADPQTATRALALELLNLELTLIESWAAAGDFMAAVDDRQPESSVSGGVLRTKRARLLVPIWSGRGAQFVPGQSAGRGVSLIVPPVPESSKAYRMVPGAIEPLRPKRVAGGTRITLDEFGLTSLVLMAGEPLVISEMKSRVERIGRRASQVRRQLAAAKLQGVERIDAQLSSRVEGPASTAWLGAAKRGLQSSDASLASADYADAYRHAGRAMRPLRLLERWHWEAATKRLPSPVSNPAAVSFATLPACWSLIERIGAAPPGANLLPGGDFENLDMLLRSGWRHFQRAPEGFRAEAELAATTARPGRYALRLAASRVEPGDYEVLAESPPSWMISPAVPVTPGAVVRIHGWVRVPKPLTGSVDGLMIVDSLAGEPLAERVHETKGWQPFTLYRAVADAQEVSVTFALTGFGEAWIDDVTIEPLQLPAPTGPHPPLRPPVARQPRLPTPR